jgi:hypothetical protein
MVCEPIDRVEVMNDARPAPSSGTTMSLPPSIWNVIVPVAGPASGTDTVAVNVTSWPTTELRSDDVTVVVVGTGATVCITEPELLVKTMLLLV